MQEHFQSSFEGKFLAERSRHRLRRPADPYAVEPWERTVLEIELQPAGEAKNYKTFYRTPARRTDRAGDRKYETMRHFSFRKEHELQGHLESAKRKGEETIENDSRQNTVNHYNINGNFLKELVPQRKPTTRHQPTLRFLRGRSGRLEAGDQVMAVGNIELIRQRVNLCRNFSQKEDEKYLQLHAEKEASADHYLCSPVKRRKKVISLGFRKLSVGTRLLKQATTLPLPFML